MRKVMMLLVFLLSSNIFAAKEESIIDENIKPVRIAFFIDDHDERFGSNGSTAATYEFTRTLSQCKSCTIIVSNYILKNMILRKYTKDPHPYPKSLDLELSDWNIYQVNNTQFFAFIPRDYKESIFNKGLWTKIDLTSGEEYNGTSYSSFSIFAIVNKLIGVVNNFPQISWADNAPIEAKRLLSNKDLKYIPYAKDTKTDVKDLLSPEHKNFNSNQLSLIFNNPPAKEDKTVTYELNSLPACNIYIFGHGNYSAKKENITIAGMSVDNIVNTLLFFNDKLNTKSVRITSCYSGGKNLDLIQTKNNIPIRMKYMLIVDSITDTTVFRISAEKFKNLNRIDKYFEALDRFQDSYESFSDQVKVIKSKTTSPTKIKAALKKLEKSSGLNGILQQLDLVKDWYFIPNGPANFPQIWVPEVGWFQTFDLNPNIQKITDVNILQALAKPEFIENEEVEIEDTRKTPPQIKKVIIKSRLKKMDFADTETIYINKNTIHKKLALLLYSEIVFANLNIFPAKCPLTVKSLCKSDITWWLLNTYKYFPSIPCLDTIYSTIPISKNFYIYPQIISMQRGDSINLLSKITVANSKETPIATGILNFLRDSLLILRGRKSEKIFFIKELEGFNDFSQILDKNDTFKIFLDSRNIGKRQIILKNVFVKTSSAKLDGTVLNVDISFEFEGEYWALKQLNKKFYFDQKPDLPTNKSLSLWLFENSRDKHEEYISAAGLTFLAKLSPTEYYAQLPIIMDIFQDQNTSIKIKNPSGVLSLKDFLLGLTPENVEKIREWTNYKQQLKLARRLRNLKISLGMLKQKLLMLNLKLEHLKNCLTGTA